MSSAKGLVIHEVFHGLGFGSGAWLNAYGSGGQRRTLLEQRRLEAFWEQQKCSQAQAV